jgi:CheY-like chemotaxis protein
MVINSKVNILVVDDNEMIRELVCLLLSSLGYLPTPAQDATEAIDCMNNNDSFQLVLTDINMPQIDGWELALHIKDLKPDIPVVALTGEAPNKILPRLPGSGIDYALFKPIKLEVLRDAISTILESLWLRLA